MPNEYEPFGQSSNLFLRTDVNCSGSPGARPKQGPQRSISAAEGLVCQVSNGKEAQKVARLLGASCLFATRAPWPSPRRLCGAIASPAVPAQFLHSIDHFGSSITLFTHSTVLLDRHANDWVSFLDDQSSLFRCFVRRIRCLGLTLRTAIGQG
jgi:hypothetical protein